MSLLPFLHPAKEGMKPAGASQGPMLIVNKVYKEVGGASAPNNYKSKRKQGEYQIVSDTVLVNTLITWSSQYYKDRLAPIMPA